MLDQKRTDITWHDIVLALGLYFTILAARCGWL